MLNGIIEELRPKRKKKDKAEKDAMYNRMTKIEVKLVIWFKDRQ